MTPLSSRRRSELRSDAHPLTPIVIIGDKGLTDTVMAEIDRSLLAHELIKVRAAAGEREARAAWLEAICARLLAHPVQRIGKIFVLYRENPDKRAQEKKAAAAAARSAGPKRRPPAPKRRPPAGEDRVKRTSRPRSPLPSPRPESEPRRRRPRTSR